MAGAPPGPRRPRRARRFRDKGTGGRWGWLRARETPESGTRTCYEPGPARSTKMTRAWCLPLVAGIALSGLAFVGPAASLIRISQGARSPASPMSAYGIAGLGKLTLTSAVLLSDTGARFLAGWLSPAASCSATRHVVLDATLQYSPLPRAPGSTRSFRLGKLGTVANCSESGPNFGVSFSAGRHHLACNNLRWLPGQYSFSTTVIATAPNGATPDVSLRAEANLQWIQPTPCQ